MKTRRASRAFVVLLMVAVTAGRVSAAAVRAPQSIEVGGSRLTLTGEGTRSKFFFVDLYSVALYLPHPFSAAGRIWDEGVPKALRVEILYGGSLPDKIPKSWKVELLPALTFEQKEDLARVYASLNTGDTILITYAPDSGTRILVGDAVVLTDPGDALIHAFLDLWVGKSPVSKELRGSLLGG